MIGNNIMILDMIGHQLVDSKLVHVKLTKAGSALVEACSSSPLTFSCKYDRKLCSQSHCSEQKANLKTKSVEKITFFPK